MFHSIQLNQNTKWHWLKTCTILLIEILFSIIFTNTWKTNNWLDLEPISQEEWDNVICKDVNIIRDKDCPEGKKSFKESHEKS